MNSVKRKDFGFCYLNKNLYVIGGTCQGMISSTCERYDIRTNEWIEIAPMNKILKDCSVCNFSNRYLFRFYGVNSYGNIDDTIERYDSLKNRWTIMNVSGPAQNDVYSTMCCQINDDHIFIFGGKNINGFPPTKLKGFLLKVEDRRSSNNAEIIPARRSVLMSYAGNFTSNSLVVENGKIIFMREDYSYNWDHRNMTL